MTADRTKTGPSADNPGEGKGPPGSAKPKRPLDPEPTDSQEDIKFKQSMANFSQRLRDWEAQYPPADSGAAKDARRAALREYDLARSRRLKSWLTLAGSGAASACIAYLIVMIASPSERSPTPAATANAASARPIETVTVMPMPATKPPSTPVAEPRVVEPPVVEPPVVAATAAPDSLPKPALASALPTPPPASVTSMPTTASPPPPVPPAPANAALKRDEIQEVQTRLRSFGFDPGPADGNAGRMTEAAVMRYQQERGQQQTGTADRQLLEQLRQDPAPQVAQRPVRPARAPAVPRTRRSDGPFEPVRATGERIGRWLESVLR